MEKPKNRTETLTVGKVLLVYEISMQVFPTAPSPTVTHLMNRAVLISRTPLEYYLQPSPISSSTISQNITHFSDFRFSISIGEEKEAEIERTM